MSDIFLSYSRSDKKKAQTFAEALKNQGYSIWWDPIILGGARFNEVIQEELNAAKCVIVLWSKNSVKSDWVKDEATRGKRKLIPILIDDVEIPIGFGQIHALNFINWEGTLPHSEFDVLLDSVKKILGHHPLTTKPSKMDETFTNSIGMEFVLILAGEFMMGSEEYGKEKPVHKVMINKPFYLGNYPVTQKEWTEIMINNPSYFKGDDLPVEHISWNDIQEFINKLNEKEGVNNYRLPSEAEWEYAARAGTTTQYSFGDDESKLGDYAWFDDNSDGKTHSVGQKQPNPWGLYDMNGNVWEWVQDNWHRNYNSAPDNGSAWEDEDGSARVDRGGSWGLNARSCRSADRFYNAPGDRRSFLGFRLLKEL